MTSAVRHEACVNPEWMRLIRSFTAKSTRSRPFLSRSQLSSVRKLPVPVRENWRPPIVLFLEPGRLRVSSHSVCMMFTGEANSHPRHGLVNRRPCLYLAKLHDIQSYALNI
ncbi:hypothetical protein HBI14_235170 [Parastagonospora nodorum]|nr:hypothetical protein HBI14_235170 [Parastagonospora nodorum]